MRLEPEFALFIAAGLLTLVVASVVGMLLRHAFREERTRKREEGR